MSKVFRGVLIILTLYASVFSVAEASTIGHPVDNAGLVGYWSMDEGTGGYIYDRSGNGITGALVASPKWVESNTGLGQALSFNGSSQFVNFGNKNLFTGDFTFSFWVNWTSGGGVTIAKEASADGSYQFRFTIDSSGNTDFTSSNNGNSQFFVGQLTSSVSSGVWTHFVVVKSGGTNYYLYKNGVQVNKVVASSDFANNNSHDFTLGARDVNGGGFTDYLNGKMDEVRVYNRPLSADEVSRLYKLQKPLVSNGVTNTGLVGYWPLDEGTGTRAEDHSFNNNTGTLSGSPVPTWTSGKLGGALTFDSTQNYVDIGAPANLELYSNFTMSAWIKTSADYTSAAGFAIAKDFSTGARGFGIGVSGSNKFYLEVGGGVQINNSGPLINNSVFHHIAVTENSSSGTWTGYVDGVSVGTAVPGAITANPSAHWYIGGREYAGNLNGIKGIVDDVRIYNRVLSDSEIYSLYKGSKASVVNDTYKTLLSNGLVGYWTFDGKDIYGTTAIDRSVNGNNGTLTNGPVPVLGKIGQALSFDNVDDIVTVGTGSSLNITGVKSISAWIYPKSFGGNSKGRIFDKDDTGSELGYEFQVDNSNVSNGISYIIGSGASFCSSNSNVINLNEWQHVVMIYDGSNCYFYVNGVAAGSQAFSTNANSAPSIVAAIGARVLDTGRQFDGKIDDVRVYNRALTSDEVKLLYNMGK